MITGREPARISAMQRDKATSRIRTDDLCFTKALGESVTEDTEASHTGSDSNGSSSGSSSTPPDAAAQQVVDALMELAGDDRAAISAHVRALARLSPARRAAILTLANPEA